MSDLILSITLGAAAAAVLLGISLLWIAGLLAADAELHRTALQLAGGTLTILGLAAGSLIAVQAFAIPLWIILGVYVLMCLVRYRTHERNALYWMLTAAAERGLPLDRAAYAFAAERGRLNDTLFTSSRASQTGASALTPIPRRARLLGDLLQQGHDLLPALHAARLSPDLDVATVLIVGARLGAVRGSLRQLLNNTRDMSTALQRMMTRTSYLMLVALATMSIANFVALRILPATASFGVGGAWLSGGGARGGEPLMALFAVALAPLILAFWVLSTFNLLDLDLPGLTRLVRSLDIARVQRALGWSLQSQVRLAGTPDPLLNALALLARRYPKASIRHQLLDVLRAVEQGNPWQTALQRQGLLSHRETAVLNAAQRAGNLPWALWELADRRVSQWRSRAQHLQNVLFPCALVVAGLLVMLLALEIIVPLSQIMESIA